MRIDEKWQRPQEPPNQQEWWRVELKNELHLQEKTLRGKGTDVTFDMGADLCRIHIDCKENEATEGRRDD